MKEHISGFDYLRAVLSVFVVILHCGKLGAPIDGDVGLEEIVRFNLFFLAVPMFIFMSIYLFAEGDVNRSILVKKIVRSGRPLLFWCVAIILFYRGWGGLERVGMQIISGNWQLMTFALLSAGNTVFYFFVSLIICLVVAFAFYRAGSAAKWGGLVASIVLVFYLRDLSVYFKFPFLAIYSCPLNFLPYVFMAMLFSDHKQRIKSINGAGMAGLFALYAVVCAIEWYFVIQNPAPTVFKDWMPGYTRVSLVFGVLFMGVLALNIKRPAGKIISFMSTYSLAMYCLHRFFLGTYIPKMERYFESDLGVVASVVALTLVSGYVATYILKQFLNRKVLF